MRKNKTTICVGSDESCGKRGKGRRLFHPSHSLCDDGYVVREADYENHHALEMID